METYKLNDIMASYAPYQTYENATNLSGINVIAVVQDVLKASPAESRNVCLVTLLWRSGHQPKPYCSTLDTGIGIPVDISPEQAWDLFVDHTDANVMAILSAHAKEDDTPIAALLKCSTLLGIARDSAETDSVVASEELAHQLILRIMPFQSFLINIVQYDPKVDNTTINKLVEIPHEMIVDLSTTSGNGEATPTVH